MRAIDSHAHLNFFQFDADREALIADYQKKGLGVINISTDLESIDPVLKLAESYPHIWAAIGIHPTDVDEALLTGLPELLKGWGEKIQEHSKIVAIGEIGLDYFHKRDSATIHLQQMVLRDFLVFSQEQELPVIIHCRDGYGDLSVVLADYPELTGVIHCFNGNASQAERFLELGYYLSFTAMVTYPANEQLRQIAKSVPKDKLLIETDSPFLPYHDKRGERNDPSTIWRLAEYLADLRGENQEDFLASTLHNTKTLFKLEIENV